jgi:hypothetical protein
LVDEERVYKCIDNNYGAPSTVAPTHTDTDVKTLSTAIDGSICTPSPKAAASSC